MESKAVIEILERHPFLEGMKASHVQKMAAMALEVTFVRDQVIFREGEECSLFYLLLAGRVALEVSAPGRIIRIATLGEGDELGWSSLLTERGKQFQARSLEPVRTLAFDGTRLRHACEQDPAFGYMLMLRILKGVARRLQATRMQLMDLYAPRAVKLV